MNPQIYGLERTQEIGEEMKDFKKSLNILLSDNNIKIQYSKPWEPISYRVETIMILKNKITGDEIVYSRLDDSDKSKQESNS